MEKLTKQEIFELSKDAYFHRSSNVDYTAEERLEGLRSYLADLNKDYRNNKNEIFQIIEDTMNIILPTKVQDAVQKFAEFQTFGQNETVRFKVKNGKIKAVAMAIGGVAERTRVDKGWVTIKCQNIQCKVYEEYERFISGQVDWTELVGFVADAIMEEVMVRVYVALTGVFSNLPTMNQHSTPAIDTVELDKIINVVKAYGTPVIMGTPLAVAQIPLSANATESDKEDIRNHGYLGKYKGCDVVELSQSFTDETNTVKVFDDQYLFIIPSGQEKIVKVGFEGGLITRETNGADWTMNFEAYQKVGVSVFYINNIGMYKMTSLA